MNQSQRSAIITGASRGIGKAIALRLAGDGFAITVNYSGSLGRLGTVEDIVGVVSVLVGPDCSWVTGQNIRANGGLI